MIAAVTDMATVMLWLGVVVAGAALSGLYSGLETGVYVLNKTRLDLHAETGRRSARILKRMLGNYSNLLAVVLIGTNLANYAATFAVTALFLLAGAGDRAEWYTIATATPVLFIVGESVPKLVFQRLAERLVYRLWWVLSVSSALFTACGVSPLVRGFSSLMMRLTPGASGKHVRSGQDGFAAIVAEGRAAGVLTDFQSSMADRVVRIGRVTLARVMQPMRSVMFAPEDISRDELIELLRTHNYSRVPLLNADGKVTGILDVYDVMLGEASVTPGERAVAPLVLSGETPVTDALYQMQRLGKTMAIVEDDDSRHTGLVTLKDLVEEIVGELEVW